MARRTAIGTLLRAGFDFLMTPGTLLVKGIRSLGNFGVIAFTFVALDTGRRLGLAFFQGMVTVAAGKAIAGSRCMGLVVKQDISGNTLKHEPYRAVRRFCGKRGITENTHNEQNDSQSISHLQLFFGNH